LLNGAQPEAQETPYNTVVSTAQHKFNSFMYVKAANNINLPSQKPQQKLLKVAKFGASSRPYSSYSILVI